MHLYAPRLAQGFNSLDSLDVYCIGRAFSPSHLSRSHIIQLNLFASHIYFQSYSEYVEVSTYLGLAWAEPKEGQSIQADGFIMPPAGIWDLEKSPVAFLRKYAKNRRGGTGTRKADLGRAVDGEILEKCDFGCVA